MDPDNLPTADASSMNFASGSSKPKAWKSIWGSGQGIGAVHKVSPARELVDQFVREYRAACAEMLTDLS
ncbi:MAG: nitronate monooxygenase, partial [Paracoccaceae bacterium]